MYTTEFFYFLDQIFMLFSCEKYRKNRPFPSCFEPHYESEAKCKVFVMKISFHSSCNKTNFHVKSFALSLAFIVRFTATRKWPTFLVNFSSPCLRRTKASNFTSGGIQYCTRFDKRSRDRYNVELRFKGYFISAGQTSLPQVK